MKRLMQLLLVYMVSLSYALASNFQKIDKNTTAQELVEHFIPGSEAIVLADVINIQTFVQTSGETATKGAIAEKYTIDNIETIISTNDSLGDRLEIVSLGGDLIDKKLEDFSHDPELQSIIGPYLGYRESIGGWDKITEYGRHLIFIESTKRNRFRKGESLYLIKAYKIHTLEKEFIVHGLKYPRRGEPIPVFKFEHILDVLRVEASELDTHYVKRTSYDKHNRVQGAMYSSDSSEK